MSTVDVGGIQITPFDSMEDAVAHVIQSTGITPGFGIAINPEKIIMARKDVTLRDQLNSGTLRFADGMGVVKTMRKKGVPSQRIPGVEFWQALMMGSREQQVPVMLIGARPEINQQAAAKLKAAGVNVVANIDGYFTDEHVLIEALHKHQPKIVSVAMGSPRQELLIARLREHYPDAFYQGVGGTYDVFTGHVKRAPKLFCKLHLEWFYRLCAQPTRIARQLNLIKYVWLHFTGRL